MKMKMKTQNQIFHIRCRLLGQGKCFHFIIKFSSSTNFSAKLKSHTLILKRVHLKENEPKSTSEQCLSTFHRMYKVMGWSYGNRITKTQLRCLRLILQILLLKTRHFATGFIALSQTLREELSYENREDWLLTRKVNLVDRKIEESFSTGREDCLKGHQCTIDEETKPETDRTLEFYGDNRADGLYKLVETPNSIIEHFQGQTYGKLSSYQVSDRDDKLYYREIIFGERPKKLMPASSEKHDRISRPVFELIERFNRNEVIFFILYTF